MSDFLRSLLTAEAHSDPYVWAAVALAHAMIGASLMIFAGLLAAALMGDPVAGLVLVAAGYAVWEVMQTLGGGGVLDAGLDWLMVMLGASIVVTIWRRRLGEAAAAVALMFSIIFGGVLRRVRGRP